MEMFSIRKEKVERSRWVLFLALSRTPHLLLDMAAPGLAALLLLDGFPSFGVTLLGMFTVFSGYTSVYALNDLIDCRSDRIKIAEGRSRGWEGYLDSVILRHPLARGLLEFREGIFWSAAWGVLAFAGAYVLNPLCSLIFVAGCALEAVYCLLWRVSHLRAIITGVVKSSGPVAAVVAIHPEPPAFFLLVLFLWFYTWEIGGQNIPADWAEVEDDRHLKARTIPVRLGPRKTGLLMLILLVSTVLLSLLLLWVRPLVNGAPCAVLFLAAGVFLLLIPGLRLYRSGDPLDAMVLFNRSSFYPFVLLIGMSLKVVS
jgi:4-hydroxybenzoate polyprenyltransferase